MRESPWRIGARYGNAFTELIRGDYEMVIMVRTHDPVSGGKPHLVDYEWRADAWPTLVHLCDTLNASNFAPLAARSTEPRP
jgi:hypothetical protein